MKRTIALLLVAASVFILSACQNNEESVSESTPNYSASAADADVWCVEPYVQVLANLEASEYADVMLDKIDVHSAKNEYETAQIIISAKKDLKFTVSVSNLVHTEDSTAVISGENCTVYTMKYIGIAKNWHNNNAPTGEYPDALLPQENAVIYEQNIVKAGTNGGAWLSFFVPAESKAGKYTGMATVDLGQEQIQVEISLTVYDVAISNETTSKSLFTINEEAMKAYELDSTEETSDAYIQFLINHRSAPSHFFAKQELAEEGDSSLRVWAKTAYYWYEKGLRTIPLRADMATVDGYGFLSIEGLTGSLLELAKISLEKGVDLVSLAAVYDWPIDEPFYIEYTAEHVQHNIDKFNEVVADAAAQLEAIEGFDSELGKRIIESVKKTPHIITDYIGDEYRLREPMVFEDGTAFSYVGQNVAVCPKFDGYSTLELRERYNSLTCEEKWWYGCNGPNYPYPSYHTDDSPVSAAVLGWMMADYGVTGNLYWAINYSYEGGEIVEDPYRLADWGSGANGDGIILYPGKLYGVDGPVETIRMQAILDGNEDYELVKDIMRKYEENGISADGIIERITASVYTDSRVTGGSTQYEEARQILLSVAQAADSKAELMIGSIQEQLDADGRRTYVVFAQTAEGAQLYQDGQLLSETDGAYSIVCDLSEAKNYLSLQAVKDGESAEFSIYLGGMQKLYNADQFATEDFTGSFTSAELMDGIYLMQFADEEEARFKINHESIQNISAETAAYTLKLQNNGGEATYKVYVTYSGFGRVELGSGSLTVGENELRLTMFSTVNWERNGELVEMEIVLKGTDSVGISQIVVDGK